MSGQFEDMMAMLGQSGWDKFEDTGALLKQQQQAVREAALSRAADLARCFEGDAGREFLAVLEREFVHRPHMLPFHGKFSAEQQAIFSAFRQGQKDVVASIVNAILAVRGEGAQIQQKGEA